MYAIGNLIVKTMEEKKVTTYELVKKMGYQDFNRGLKDLKQVVGQGEYMEQIEQKLRRALDIGNAEIKEAYVETMKQKNKEKILKVNEKKHVPNAKTSLFVKLEKINPTGPENYKKFKKIAITQQLLSLEWLEQIRFVQSMITHHYAKNKLKMIDKGYHIKGYAFYIIKDNEIYEKVYFDEKGAIKKVITPDFPKVISALSLKQESQVTSA